MMMIASPRVSVVVPTKDRPALLSDAVNSVLSQTMSDLEIIVVDDCSQPPVDAAKVNGGGDKRLRTERLSVPAGAVVAKNRGAALSRAPILAFLDDDDLYTPGYLEQALRALERYPALDVVFMGVEYFSDCPGTEVCQHRDFMREFLTATGSQEKEDAFYLFGDRLLRGMLLTGIPMAFQRPVVRTAAFEKVGGYRMRRYWDNDWSIRVAKAGLGIGLLDKGLYRQRVGQHQYLSTADSLEHCDRDLETKREILKELSEGDCDRALFRQAVSQSLFCRAYLHREEEQWWASARDFLASEMTWFDYRRFRFLASITVCMARCAGRRLGRLLRRDFFSTPREGREG